MTASGALNELIRAWLLGASVTAAVLVPLAFVACRRLRLRTAATRYQIWLYVLLAIVLLPLLRLSTPKVSLAVLPVPEESVPPGSSREAARTAGPLEPLSPEEGTLRAIPDSPRPPEPSLRRGSDWLLAGWLLGFAWMLGRLVVSAVRLRRLRRRAEPAPGEPLRAVGVTPPAPVLLSREIEGPATCGLLRPVIVLPRSALDRPDADALAMILEHERAHIRRGDQLALWFQRLVEAALFFHPFVWHASRELTREREFICDHHVVRSGQSPAEYVKVLSRMIEDGWGRPSAQAIALFEGNLVSRIRFLLESRHSGAPELARRTRIASAVVAAVLLLALGTLRLEARASQGALADSGGSPGPSTPALEEAPAQESIRQAMKPVVRAILEYRERRGTLPPALADLGDGLAIDPYSPTGQVFQYEPRRSSFVLTSCGPDGRLGNDDDLVLYFTEDRRYQGPHFGTRAEMSPLPEPDPDAPVEMAAGKARPEGTSSISGRVVSAANGEPLENATVYLFHVDTYAPVFVRVGRDGSFRFEDVAEGEYVLRTVRTAGYQDAIYDPEGIGGNMPSFTLAEGQEFTNIVLELKPAFGLSGRLVGDIPDELLVLAVAERKEPPGLEVAGRGRVGREGRYRIDGLDGRPVYVQVADWGHLPSEGGYCPQYYPGTFSRDEAERITFTGAPEVSNLDFPLRTEGGIVLKGTVRSEDGAPVGGAFVVAHRSDMSFDLAPAYTDNEGRYQLQCLGKGGFLVHVDAAQHNLVRTRSAVQLDGSGGATELDFVLHRGVRIAGRLVDEQGGAWDVGRGFGFASVGSGSQAGASFTLSGFENKNRTKSVRVPSGARFSLGEGDYGSSEMIFPTQSSFLLEGVVTGQTTIHFSPKREGREVKRILYKGQDVMQTGLPTRPGEAISDVVIVVGGAESAPVRPATACRATSGPARFAGGRDYDRPPWAVQTARPQYPQKAFKKKIEGKVVVEVAIDSEGTVAAARVVESIPLLDDAAIDAACQWTFAPAVKDGHPVRSVAEVPMAFRIY
jgi:TonB family protein